MRSFQTAFEEEAGLVRRHRSDIETGFGETEFISAGVQVLDRPEGEKVDSSLACWVAQPCVRLNSIGHVGRPEGILSSFVNVCTLLRPASLAGFVDLSDHWIRALSALGLHAKYITIVSDPLPYRGGPFEGTALTFCWSGIEVGEGIYATTIDGRPGDSLLDFGFGFERLWWAASGRSASYYDQILPLARTIHGLSIEDVDLVRTAGLMALTGVRGASRSAGYQFRQLCGQLARSGQRIASALPVLREVADYWAEFTPVDSPEVAAAAIEVELERWMTRRLGVRAKDRSGGSLERTVTRLHRTGVSPDLIRWWLVDPDGEGT